MCVWVGGGMDVWVCVCVCVHVAMLLFVLGGPSGLSVEVAQLAGLISRLESKVC